MESKIKELGSIRMLHPHTTLSNTLALRNYAAKNFPDINSADTWSCLRGIMHKDLNQIKRKEDLPEQIWFNPKTSIFASALKNLMGGMEIPLDVEYSLKEQATYQQHYEHALK